MVQIKTFSFSNIIQHILSIIILVFFITSLFPRTFEQYYMYLIIFTLLQILISLSRFRIFNFAIQIFLLIIAFIISIPYIFEISKLEFLVTIILYGFKIIVIPVALLDTITYRSQMIFQNFSYYNQKQNKKQEKPKVYDVSELKTNKKGFEFEDADFKEK